VLLRAQSRWMDEAREKLIVFIDTDLCGTPASLRPCQALSANCARSGNKLLLHLRRAVINTSNFADKQASPTKAQRSLLGLIPPALPNRPRPCWSLRPVLTRLSRLMAGKTWNW